MLTMLMKMHSYGATNREFAFKLDELKRLKKQIATESKTETDAASSADVLEDRIAELESELFPGGDVAPYPQNLTLYNFIDFLRMPVLVYQLSYPRTTRIRKLYLLEKIAGFIACLILCYIDISTWILPVLEMKTKISVVDAIGDLLFPMLLAYLLIFLMIWEYLTNTFAELSYFADRDFYGEWLV